MNGADSFPWTTTEHCERYCQLVKSQQRLLRSAWDDLELSADEQASQLKETANQAEDVWREALRHVENQRASVREQIDDAHSRIDRLKGELSDEAFPETEVRIIEAFLSKEQKAHLRVCLPRRRLLLAC